MSLAAGLIICAALLAVVAAASRGHRALSLTIEPAVLPADGWSSASLTAGVRSAAFAIVEGHRIARIEEGRIRAGVLPGSAVVEAKAPGFAPARARIETKLDASDRAGDGTPDFLRLDDDADRRAFVAWFTLLAESQFFAPRPLPEINDCAALIRFAYREALREHDGSWAASMHLPVVPALPPVAKYRYPFTPLGARLFRVVAGPFTAADLGGSAFAEFADAHTLIRRNAFFVTRDIARAAPGDLLFFRQPDQQQPFHAMIFLGASRIEPPSRPLIVYHTGAFGGGAGEIRRPSVDELMHHPLPAWRPAAGNANFLGVYRWNILRRTL